MIRADLQVKRPRRENRKTRTSRRKRYRSRRPRRSGSRTGPSVLSRRPPLTSMLSLPAVIVSTLRFSGANPLVSAACRRFPVNDHGKNSGPIGARSHRSEVQQHRHGRHQNSNLTDRGLPVPVLTISCDPRTGPPRRAANVVGAGRRALAGRRAWHRGRRRPGAPRECRPARPGRLRSRGSCPRS
jgi:hypothetical protein